MKPQQGGGWVPPVIEGLRNLKEVGRGGFGVVFQAEDAAHARTVAVKILRESFDETSMARFERECRAAGSLSGHPNIVSFHGSGVTANGEPFLVMDYLPGGSLADRVATTGLLGVAEVIELGVGLASALSAAHDQGVVHRDLKPENVLYSAFGLPQLVDFGIARMVSEFETRTGSISASLAHAPPEVIAGAPPSTSGDLYSLASVLYFALSGSAPFSVAGEVTLAPLIARISAAQPPDLGALGVPAPLAEVVERGLSKSPEQREPTARAFGEVLRYAARELGVPVPALAVSPGGGSEPESMRWRSGPATTPRLAAGSAPGPETVDLTPPTREPAGRSAGLLRSRARVLVLGLVTVSLLGAAAVAISRDRDRDRPGAGSVVGADGSDTTVPAPLSPPGAPSDVLVDSPSFLGDDRFRVSVHLSWSAPAEGRAITGYRIRHRQRWTGACVLPAGNGEIEQVEVGAVTSSTQYSDTEYPCGWVAWEVAAMNRAGVGPFAPARAVVPDVVDLPNSFHLVRAVGGLASGVTRAGCGVDPSLACETSPSAGTRIEPGTLVAVYLPPPS